LTIRVELNYNALCLTAVHRKKENHHMRTNLTRTDLAYIICKFTEAFWKLNTVKPGDTYSVTSDVIMERRATTDIYLHLKVTTHVESTSTDQSRRGRVKVEGCIMELASAYAGFDNDEPAQMFTDLLPIYRTGMVSLFGQGQFINESVAREAEWLCTRLDRFIDVEMQELKNKAENTTQEEIAK